MQKTAFRMAVLSLTQSRSALGAFYRRLRSRLGAPKATTACAHMRSTYVLPYVDYNRTLYRSWHGRLRNKQVLKNLRNKAHALGLELVPISPDMQNTPSSPTLSTQANTVQIRR